MFDLNEGTDYITTFFFCFKFYVTQTQNLDWNWLRINSSSETLSNIVNLYHRKLEIQEKRTINIVIHNVVSNFDFESNLYSILSFFYHHQCAKFTS